MPTIQIPIGGQMVNVEVNDLASENTLQNISAKANQQVDLLGRIAVGIGATTTNTQQLEEIMKNSANRTGDIINDIGRNSSERNKNDSESSKRNADRIANSAKDLFTNLETMTAAKLAQTLGNLLPGVLGAAAGTMLGTTIGMLEKFGAALNTSRRVGVGFGDTLMDIRKSAGLAGMQFDGFTAMLVQNGAAIKSLGDSTAAGAAVFGRLSRETQAVFQEFGNFGMGMTEINQMILLEVEARRASVGVTLRGDMAYRKLAESVADNVRQQEAMASVTGQDVRQRLAAQQVALSESNVRARLAGSSEELYRNFNTVSAALSRFDPSGDITNAFGQAIATGFDPMAFAPEMMSLLGPGVTGLLDQAKNNMKTMDPRAFAQWFETSMQDQFAAIKADDARINQLIMMTQSSDASLANAAKSILDSVTKQSMFSDKNYADAYKAAGISNAAEASMLSSTLDKLTAQYSSTMTTGAMASLKGIMESIPGLNPGDGEMNYNQLLNMITAKFSEIQMNSKDPEEYNNYLQMIGQLTGDSVLELNYWKTSASQGQATITFLGEIKEALTSLPAGIAAFFTAGANTGPPTVNPRTIGYGTIGQQSAAQPGDPGGM